jgi:hypothetical protein
MGMIAAANVWDDMNKEDGVGGPSGNPYNVHLASSTDEQARIHAANMKEAYEFAVDTFLSAGLERAIFDAGFAACKGMGDNHIHYHGEQADRIFTAAIVRLKESHA